MIVIALVQSRDRRRDRRRRDHDTHNGSTPGNTAVFTH